MHQLVAALTPTSSVLAVLDSASAQYLGRNKVQYQTFDFKVLTTPHFDVLFYLEDEAVIEDRHNPSSGTWPTRSSDR